MPTRELESIVQQKPVLWVGAGLSVAAGYPSTGTILSALRVVADQDLPIGDFTTVVDAFIDAIGAGELGDVLQRLFQVPHEPTATHNAIARLAAAGYITTLITTNYDDMLERALAAANVKVVVQTLEHNAEVREQDGAVRLLKIHGSFTAWRDVILSGRSYAEFDAHYSFLREQLDVVLQQRPLLFVGCSLQDPRILQWLADRPATWIAKLKRWRAMMLPSAWTAALALPWMGSTAGAVLTRASFKLIAIDRHEDLPALWLEVARRLAPLAVSELVFDVEPGEEQWRSIGPTPEFTPHIASNPLRDEVVLRDLHRLRTLMRRPVLLGDPRAAAQTTELRHVARRLGARLTDILLSPAARTAVCKRLAEADRGTARLTLRIGACPSADASLALPWELLMPEADRFAVEEAKLDLVRDAQKLGAPELDVPSKPLSVAVTIAAPDNQDALRYEDEAYRMLKALAPLGQVAHFAELGEIDDLVDLVHRTQATAVHFSGHGLPGELVFENELGLSTRVRVDELMMRLRQRVQVSGTAQPFPRFFYLASCYGASATVTPTGGAEPDTRTLRAEVSAALGDGPSTAATLHREGFACVLGYFGPIGDTASTSAEVALYSSLSEGRSLLYAVKQARASLSQPQEYAGRRFQYPLGWAHLAVYLRGPDYPLTAHPRSVDTAAPAPVRLAREIIEVSGLPVLEHGFIGRRALQHEVRRKLKQGQRLFVLQGLGGLGKTALASQLLCKVLAPNPLDQLILRVQDAVDVATLRTQAELHGDIHRLPRWDEEAKRLNESFSDPAEGFRQTVLALRRHRPALVVYADNMEALQLGPGGFAEVAPGALGAWKPGAERWWVAMESLARGGIVLASTRYTWTGIDREALVPLDRMSRVDLCRMLDTFPTLAKLPWSVRAKVADMADGRPRTLERLEGLLRQADTDPTRDISDTWTDWAASVLAHQGAVLTEDLLLTQLWRSLSQAARDHAINVSVLHLPAPRRVIDVLGTAFVELLHSGIITRHREFILMATSSSPSEWENRWLIHSSIRSFVQEQGSPRALNRARVCAGAEYEIITVGPSGRLIDVLEATRLYLSGGETKKAWPLAKRAIVFLRKLGRYMPALDLLSPYDSTNLDSDNFVESAIFRIQMMNYANTPDPAARASLLLYMDESQASDNRAFAMHEMARMLLSERRYPEAEACLHASLRIRKTIPDQDQLEQASGLHELAVVLCQQGKYSSAEQYVREALAIESQALEPNHPDLATSLHTLATILSNTNELEKALDAAHQSLAIRREAIGADSLDYARSSLAVGTICYKMHNYSEAESWLDEAILTIRKLAGEKSEEYGACVRTLGLIKFKMGHLSEAEGFHDETILVMESVFGGGHIRHLAALDDRVALSLLQGKHEEARAKLYSIISLKEGAVGSSSLSYSMSLHQLAEALAFGRKYKDAEFFCRKALAIKEDALGSAHFDLCLTLVNLATILTYQDRAREGAHFIQRALEIARDALGEDNPALQHWKTLAQQIHALS